MSCIRSTLHNPTCRPINKGQGVKECMVDAVGKGVAEAARGVRTWARMSLMRSLESGSPLPSILSSRRIRICRKGSVMPPTSYSGAYPLTTRFFRILTRAGTCCTPERAHMQGTTSATPPHSIGSSPSTHMQASAPGTVEEAQKTSSSPQEMGQPSGQAAADPPS